MSSGFRVELACICTDKLTEFKIIIPDQNQLELTIALGRTELGFQATIVRKLDGALAERCERI